MSLIHCKKVYSAEGDASHMQKLPLRELRKIPDITICEGFVIEAGWTLDVNKPTVELMCVHCGNRFYFETRRYIKVLDALGVDYSGRLP
jgi:hypothetical protein